MIVHVTEVSAVGGEADGEAGTPRVGWVYVCSCGDRSEVLGAQLHAEVAASMHRLASMGEEAR